MRAVEDIDEFADECHNLLKSDRDVVVGCGGFTGEGKSCFTSKLLQSYCKIRGTIWDFSKMTWSRKELLEWIDGKHGSKPDPVTKLKKNQLPEYSGILPDELFHMFYRRTWYDQDQLTAVATFNMCRDRHLLVAGSVPDFWDLDGGFQKRVRFYIYIPTRGVAWVFEQENNPFTKDPWNVTENKKIYRKHRSPIKCPNFVCEIRYDDWTKEEKATYYKIRNTKRVQALSDYKKSQDRYAHIKDERDKMVRLAYNDRLSLSKKYPKLCEACKETLSLWKDPLTEKDIGDILEKSRVAVNYMLKGRTRVTS